MKEVLQKRVQRQRRQHRIRFRITGTAFRPRLSVFRSGGHIYAQLIDDAAGTTLASASSLQLQPQTKLKKLDMARRVGERLAGEAKKLGIAAVVFDRGGYAYNGLVKALAEGAREAGLRF